MDGKRRRLEGLDAQKRFFWYLISPLFPPCHNKKVIQPKRQSLGKDAATSLFSEKNVSNIQLYMCVSSQKVASGTPADFAFSKRVLARDLPTIFGIVIGGSSLCAGPPWVHTWNFLSVPFFDLRHEKHLLESQPYYI